MKNNPYVGPRPYERQDRHNFFGREREARELRSLILSEREVLFYAQSGAGKTSLLNARIIPMLEEEGFYVLPVARVGSELPPGIDAAAVDNVFVFSALLTLAGEDADPHALLSHTLCSFLEERFAEGTSALSRAPGSGPDHPDGADLEAQEFPGDDEPHPWVLILDQFEEVFTTHRDRWQEAEGFFLQVREALDALPDLGVVFAMREDHVAAIDPYTPIFPRRLRARFRMERLGPKGALAAVRRPAENAGCRYDPGVAERLVDNLRQTKVRRHAGEETILGPYVEPVQLQVVCSRLWENLPEQEDNAIQWEEVEQYGNIDRALTDFYEDALQVAICEPGVSERDLRRWFGKQLITPMGTRGLVLQGPTETEGLPNAAVDVLESQHIIRANVRAGAHWYELAHDRLVEPILQANQAWDAARETPLRAAARRWRETEEASLLYRDTALVEALAWAEACPDEVESYESEFLKVSQQAEQTRFRRRQLYIAGTVLAAIILVVMAVLTILAVKAQNEATGQRQVAVARLLAAQAEVERNDPRGSWTLSSLLALESLKRLPNNLEANITLFRLLGGSAQPVVRRAYGREVNVIALSPDGKWVMSGSKDGVTQIWEVNTGQKVSRMEHVGSVNTVTFSADGRWAASGGEDGVAQVWEAATGEQVAYQEHAEGVIALALSIDGRLVASGSRDGTILVWEAATGQEVACLKHQGLNTLALSPDGQWVAGGAGCPGVEPCPAVVQVWAVATGRTVSQVRHEDRVRDIAFSPDSQWIASASDDQTVRVWEVVTGKGLGRLEHDGRVYTVDFGTDGQRIVSGSDDFKARVWEIRTNQVTVMRGHGAIVTQVMLSSDGQWLVTGSVDHTVRVWDVNTGEQIARMEHEGEVTLVAFTHDDRWVVSGSRDATIGVWNVSAMLDEKRVVGRAAARVIYDGRINAVASSPDNQWMVSGGENGEMWAWDMETVSDTGLAVGREVGQMESGIKAIAYSPGGDWIVSGNQDGTVQVLDAHADIGRVVAQVKHGWQANAVAFSPNGQQVVSGGGDGTVLVWEIATGREIAKMDHGWEVNAVAFTPDGQQVVSLSHNGTALFWDVATEREVKRVAYPSPLTSVALSDDARWMVSGKEDGTVQVWETATGREIVQMKHERKVVAAVFSTDGRWVATSSEDGTARVWETISGREVSRIEHTGWPDNVAFNRECAGSPDASAQRCGWVVTISYNAAWIWRWKPENLIEQVCDDLSRNLTWEEWQRFLGGEPYRQTCPDLPIHLSVSESESRQ